MRFTLFSSHSLSLLAIYSSLFDFLVIACVPHCWRRCWRLRRVRRCSPRRWMLELAGNSFSSIELALSFSPCFQLRSLLFFCFSLCKLVSFKLYDLDSTDFIECQRGSYSFYLMLQDIDSLDTLALLGDRDRFAASVEWIGKNNQDEKHENKGKDESCEVAKSGASEREDATDEI
ncbi:putative alpha-mannosidase I [Arachis hypogaea]|nr:putative alpha-mannosidase I [Arachis hypogaea]